VHGTCDGCGNCICEAGWTLSDSQLCDCATTGCNAFVNVSGVMMDCSGHGTCQCGLSCVCDVTSPWTGAACDVCDQDLAERLNTTCPSDQCGRLTTYVLLLLLLLLLLLRIECLCISYGPCRCDDCATSAGGVCVWCVQLNACYSGDDIKASCGDGMTVTKDDGLQGCLGACVVYHGIACGGGLTRRECHCAAAFEATQGASSIDPAPIAGGVAGGLAAVGILVMVLLKLSQHMADKRVRCGMRAWRGDADRVCACRSGASLRRPVSAACGRQARTRCMRHPSRSLTTRFSSPRMRRPCQETRPSGRTAASRSAPRICRVRNECASLCAYVCVCLCVGRCLLAVCMCCPVQVLSLEL
jgi:hypothetical protein